MAKKAVEAFAEAESEKTADMMFSKEQLLSSERFKNRRDILNALLKEDVSYTVVQAENIIEKYMKGKVK